MGRTASALRGKALFQHQMDLNRAELSAGEALTAEGLGSSRGEVSTGQTAAFP